MPERPQTPETSALTSKPTDIDEAHRRSRLPYARPELVHFGLIRDLTTSGSDQKDSEGDKGSSEKDCDDDYNYPAVNGNC